MNKIKCVIVEDEIPAAEELQYLLNQFDFIEVQGIANNGVEGLMLITSLKPNAAFLDINMPLQNGIDLAKEVKNLDKNIDVIFTTAYEDHAIEAFEIEAYDYILKPYSEERIKKVVNRLKNKILTRDSEADILTEKMSELLNKLTQNKIDFNKVPCEFKGKIILISIDDIYFCYIEDNKTYIKTKDMSYYSNYTLHEIEKKTNFFRAHRSYLVNMDKVKELFSWFNGTYKLVMDDTEKSEVPISRSNVKSFKELLKL